MCRCRVIKHCCRLRLDPSIKESMRNGNGCEHRREVTLAPRSPGVAPAECSPSQPPSLSPGGTLEHPKSTFQSLTCLNILTVSVLLFYGPCCVQEHLGVSCKCLCCLCERRHREKVVLSRRTGRTGTGAGTITNVKL